MSRFPEPASTDDLRGLLLDYLDFYRAVIIAKVRGMSDADLRVSRVPSGWTPSGLINHLVHMERRWLQWGFLASPVDEPWGDRSGTGWRATTEGVDALERRLREVGERTRAIVEAHELDEQARVGGRFTGSEQAPQLQWILLHVLQEYARHAGHIDIVRELIDGVVGEEA